jgi:hypothetical protein
MRTSASRVRDGDGFHLGHSGLWGADLEVFLGKEVKIKLLGLSIYSTIASVIYQIAPPFRCHIFG